VTLGERPDLFVIAGHSASSDADVRLELTVTQGAASWSDVLDFGALTPLPDGFSTASFAPRGLQPGPAILEGVLRGSAMFLHLADLQLLDGAASVCVLSATSPPEGVRRGRASTSRWRILAPARETSRRRDGIQAEARRATTAEMASACRFGAVAADRVRLAP